MSKEKDEMPERTEENPEEVYGEVKETDPTVLNDEYEYGGGGDTDEEDEG